MDVQLPGKSVKEIQALNSDGFPGITPKGYCGIVVKFKNV
jgi:hypothetical protein